MQYGRTHIDTEIKNLRFKINALDAFFIIGMITGFIIFTLVAIPPILLGTSPILPVIAAPIGYLTAGIFGFGSQIKDDYLQNPRKKLADLTELKLKQQHVIEISANNDQPDASSLFAPRQQDKPGSTPTGNSGTQAPAKTLDILISP